MAVDIGKLNVTLSANASPFTAALTEAGAAVQGWGSSITKTLLSVTSIGAGLSLPGLLGGASAIIKEDQAAKQLGLSLADMRVAMKFGAGATDEMAGALTTLQGKLVEARLGGVAARQDFAGLAAVTGKSAGSLKAGGWSAVLDAIGGIPDPTQRAAQAFRLLGDNALPLLDRLKEGGVAGARDFIKRMGLDVSTADVQNMREIAKTTAELKAVGAGVFNQVLLGVAPVVAEIAKGFADWKIDLSGLRVLVQGLAEGMAKFVGLLGEGAGNTKLIELSFAVVWKQAERGWLNLEALMLDGINKVGNALHRRLFGDKKVYGIDDLIFGTGPGQIGGDSAETSAASAAARRDAARAGREAKALMDQMVREFGRRPSSPAGDSKGRFDNLVLKALTESFGSARGGLANPLAAFSESIAKIGLFGEAGLFAGTGGLRGRLGFKAGMDLLGAAGMATGPQFAGAAEANTREAYSAIGRFEFEGKRGGIQDQIKAAIESLIKVQERQAVTGDQMLLATQDIKSSSGKAAELLAGGGGL